MKTLLAGPDGLELGWLLMAHIPYLRYIAPKYDKVVIVCNPANEYLYKDFADEFIHYTAKGQPDRWLNGGKAIKMPKEIIRQYPKATVKTPDQKKCMSKAKKKFIRYGQHCPHLRYDLVIHARNVKNKKDWIGDRNWPVKNYVKVVNAFKGKRICSIGTQAYHIPGTDDLRNIPLSELCDIMRSSKVMISPSSGPAHLSNLCGLPLIVWTYDRYQKSIGGNNKYRYKELWRPFDTPVKVVQSYGWFPPPKVIVEKLKRFI